MGKVRLLDSNTINKIAAGEVVERPASCIKELVENSIDAGANHIEVEIVNGGKTLMRVTDDGGGMSKEDSLLAIRRHATSKLSNVQDLLTISTLGFRGEAVPTIAAVSKFTLQTRRADSELGTKIQIEGGKFIDSHEVGCKIGTTVIVEDLFFNTPARLKFLKATSTEASKIHEYIVKLALSRPEISFKLINNNRPALSTPGNGKMIDVITGVYGTEISSSLIEINFSAEDFHLSGYIGKPNFLKNYRTWQTFIINGRIVNNRTISKALLAEWIEAYKKTPNAPSQVIREQLVGKSDIDRFEYGYAGTLAKMAKMVLGQIPVVCPNAEDTRRKDFYDWMVSIGKAATYAKDVSKSYLPSIINARTFEISSVRSRNENSTPSSTVSSMVL